MTDRIIVADEYAGDGDLTDYRELVKHSPFIWQKCGEGIGGYSWYPGASAKARTADLSLGAYFWVLMREDVGAQVRQFLANAPNADAYAVDLESGPHPGHHAWNGDASKQTVLSVMHAFFDEFHKLRPDKPLSLYGASFMGNLHITWTELVGNREWILAWLPRYSGGGDIRGWSTGQILTYAEPERYGVPKDKVAQVQFTNGVSGPIPHTLPGLNRNEDLSVLLVDLAALTGQEDEMDERFTKFLEALGSKDDPTKPATPEGAAQRLKALEKTPGPVVAKVAQHHHKPGDVAEEK